MSLRDGAQDDVYEVLLRDRLYEYYTVNIEKDPYSHGVLKLLEQTMTKHQALLTLHEMTLIQDRIKKQHEIYSRYESINEIPDKENELLTKKYFKVSFNEVYNSLRGKLSIEIIKLAEEQPKNKMALIFKELLEQCFDDALKDKNENRVNYQIISTNAIADLNKYLKDTLLMEWKNRKTADIGKKLMVDGEKYLTDICKHYLHLWSDKEKSI